MIASSLVAAALASTNPAQATSAASAPAHDHAAMGAGHSMKGQAGMAEGKMDCCKDGCACCGKKDPDKTANAKPAS